MTPPPFRISFRRAALASVPYSALLFGGTLATCHVSFETNDDVGILLRLSGLIMAHEPSPDVMFLNIAIGKVLAQLYAWSISQPWYGLFQLLTLFGAMAAVSTVTTKTVGTWRGLFLSTLLFFIVFFRAIVTMQFTRTAIIAAACGGFLALATTLAEHRRTRMIMAAGSIGLLLTGLLVRNAVALAAVAVVTSALVWAFRLPEWRKLTWRPWAFAAIVAIAMVLQTAFGLWDRWNYTRPEWEDYNRMRPIRVQFIDWSSVTYDATTKKIFDDAGMSRNDYEMMRRWFYADRTVFDLDKLNKILVETQALREVTVDRITYQLRAAIDAMKLAHKNLAIIGAIFGMTLLFGLRPAAMTFVGTAVVFAVFGWLASFRLIPARVGEPMLSIPILMGLGALLWHKDRWRQFALWQKLLIGAATCFVAVQAFESAKEVVGLAKERQERGQKTLAAVQKLPKDTVYLLWGATLRTEEFIYPFSDLQQWQDSNFRLLSLGWSVRSPHFDKQMEATSITDPYMAPFVNDKVRVIARPRIWRSCRRTSTSITAPG